MVGRLAAHVLRHTLPFFHRVPVLVRRHRKGFSYLFLHQPFFNTFSVLFPGHGFLVAAVLQRFHADTPRLRQTVQLHAVQASFEISSCVAYPVSRWSQRSRGAEFRQDMTLTSSRDDATPSSRRLSKESISSAAQLFNRIVVFPAVLKNQVPTNLFRCVGFGAIQHTDHLAQVPRDQSTSTNVDLKGSLGSASELCIHSPFGFQQQN